MLKKILKKAATKIIYQTICLFRSTGTISFKSILIIAPHPDDEVIGLGGLMIQTLQSGGKVDILYLTDGEGSGAARDQELTKQARIALSEKVAQRLSIQKESIHRLHLPDSIVSRLGKPGFEEGVTHFKELIDSLNPEAVFATDPLEFWPFDHLACSEMAIEAVNRSESKPSLWFYWVWTWFHLWHAWKSPWKPFCKLRKIGISGQMKQKKELMDLYLKPLSPEGKPWSGVLPEAMLYPFTKPFEFIRRY
ncbi:MAG: PIG-L family deacetylase [Bacteroidales bacterium]